MARQAGILGLFALGVLLGALREFLFLNLNYQIDFAAHKRQVSYAHSMFRGWVEGMDLGALLLLKWVLALCFVAAMLLLALALARLLFGDHRYRPAILIAFGAIGGLALVLHLLGGHLPQARPMSVKLLHTLQYPVLLFFIWAASFLGRARRGAG
jgi:hypothetical protein